MPTYPTCKVPGGIPCSAQLAKQSKMIDVRERCAADQLGSAQKLLDHEKEARQQAQDGLARLHTECWQHKEARDDLQTRLAVCTPWNSFAAVTADTCPGECGQCRLCWYCCSAPKAGQPFFLSAVCSMCSGTHMTLTVSYRSRKLTDAWWWARQAAEVRAGHAEEQLVSAAARTLSDLTAVRSQQVHGTCPCLCACVPTVEPGHTQGCCAQVLLSQHTLGCRHRLQQVLP